MRHRIASPVLVAAAIAVVAGCSSGRSSPATGTASSFPPVTNPPSPSPSVSLSPSASVTPSPTTAGVAACGTGELKLSLGQSQGGAGNFYQPVVLTNVSGAACTLRGYPGVSFVDGSGNQLGPAAARSSGPRHRILLAAHGGQASALLHTVNAGNFDAGTCQPRTSARLRVYPPNTRQSLLVTDHQQVCTTNAARPDIGPLVAGSNAGQ